MALDVSLDQVVIVGRAPTRDNHATTPDRDVAIVCERHDRPEDLTVQVKLTLRGCWHRKAIGGRETACGRPMGGYASRDESYAGELCVDGCFSKHELEKLAPLERPQPAPYVDDD